MASCKPDPLGLTRSSAQRGFGMYVVVMIIGAVATITVASVLTARALQNRELVDQANVLSEAKLALTSWVITSGSSFNTSSGRPGDLPSPDVADTSESPAPNYDGDPESGCMDSSRSTGLPLTSGSQNVRCLGRLPWKTLKMTIQAPSENDSEGRMPWYAVSANLTRIDSCLPVLNPSIITRSYPGSHTCGTSSLPYPWLTVRDTRGNVISNRVAFVVILPGSIIGNQLRRTSPNLGTATDYLDSMTVPSECSTPCIPGTYSNADLDNDFIAGDITESFNDRLVYVTIDDLMTSIENHVAATIAGTIRNFATTYSESASNPRYPWLSTFNPAGSATPDATIGSNRGTTPTHIIGNTFTTGFTWAMSGTPPVTRSGTVSSSAVRNYTVTSNQGSCLWSSIGMHRVECTATVTNPEAGVTRRAITLRYNGSSTSYTVSNDSTSSNLVVSPATSSSLTTRSVNRTTLGSVTLQILDYDDTSITWTYNPFTGSWTYGAEIVGYGMESAGSGYSIRTTGIIMHPVLPAWYSTNEWHRYTYVVIASGYQPGSSNNCSGGCLTVRHNTTKILTSTAQLVALSAGNELGGQNRSPHNTTLSNYFDNSNNASPSSIIFDRQTPRSSVFNDQIAFTPQ